MPNMNEELARANGLTTRARNARADGIELMRRANEIGETVTRLEERAQRMPLHWEERRELVEAREQRDEHLSRAKSKEREHEELKSEANKVFVAQGRAHELRTQYGLNDAEAEEVFSVYLRGGSYAEAKRKAASLAAKATGKPASNNGIYAFNQPGNVRW